MNEDKFADYDLIDLKNKRKPETSLLSDAWTLLLRYKFVFALCLILSLILGYIYIRTTPKKFMRTATVMVKDAKKGMGLMESQTFNDVLTVNSNSLENEVGIFKSRRLMKLTVERLKLNVSYKALNLKKSELYTSSPINVRFLDNDNDSPCSMVVRIINRNALELSKMTSNQAFSKTMRIPANKIVNTPIGKLIIEIEDENVSKDLNLEISVSKSSLKTTAKVFCHKLNVEMSGTQSSLLELSIVDENFKRAEDILNTLIDVYNRDAIDDRNKVAINTANFINERLIVIEKELGLVDSEIENYKQKNKLTDIVSESNVSLGNSNKLDNEGLSIDNQLNMAEYIKAYLIRNNKTSEMIPASIGINDNGISSQISNYNELVSKRNKLLANSSEQNPLIKDMDITLKSQRNATVRALDNLCTSLKVQTINMQEKEQETSDKIMRLPTQQKRLVSIERQQKIKEELYLYLLNKKEENELQQTITESNCKIVDTADGSSSPVSPNKIQVILICLIAGFSVSSLWLYIRSLMNMNVYVKEDIKDKISIPFLGEIPFDKNDVNKDIMFVAGDAHQHINEALRIVRENLSFMIPGAEKECKVIQFISFNPDSGKTFIAINLASCMAFSGKRVVVLDLDLRKASLTRRLGFSTKQIGISNYLSGMVSDTEGLIQSIDGPLCSFDVITSGTIPPNPAELLKEKRLEILMEQLKQQYDYILLDNPPYSMVVDAFICSRLSDYTVYIVRSGMFDKRLIPDLEDLYNSRKIKHLGLLLNGVDYKKMAYNYKYHYKYSSHYHYGAAQKPNCWYKRFGQKLFNLYTKK